MAAKLKADPHLAIAHVLFIDVVGYSKLLVNEQREVVDQLTRVVRKTPQFRKSEAAGKLIRIPVGDGMALAFFETPEEPVQCAMELARALKNHPRIRLRMGVHSGPVDQVKDVNDRLNVAGAGMNMAQRVMDCGDAGHILLSKRVADDLAQDSLWHPHLHGLGEIEVKHGAKLGIVNLYTEELGNPDVPQKFRELGSNRETPGFETAAKPGKGRLAVIAVAVIFFAALAVGVLSWLRRGAPALSGVATPAPAAANLPAVPEKSIAVLPFQNLSKNDENAFFADGVQDEILTDLAKVADLKVISRTSVMQYKSGVARSLREIGQQLGVAHVVEGSVQRSGNRVRVNAQLVDARTDRHLWGQTYDRDLADVFAIQSEIAKTIADQLQAKLSLREKNAIELPPTSDISAFDLYTRAKNILLRISSGTDTLQAVDLLNQAVARDPSFFDAYCQLAYAHDALYFFGADHTSARLALAEAALQAASRLRPDAGETHLARGWNLYWAYGDYDGALAELEAARQTLPNDARIFRLTGYIQRRQGHWEESTRNLERAVELDPRDIETLGTGVAGNYWLCRRYAEVKPWFARALAFEPNDARMKVSLAGVDFDWKADTQPWHETIDSIRATNPAAVPSIANDWLICALAERDAAAAKDALMAIGAERIALAFDNIRFNRPFAEGVIARMTKDDEKARSAFTAARAEQEKIVQAQPNYGPALCVLGLIDAGLGRKEEALREGRRAVELLHVEKDSVNGAAMVKYLAMIAAWVGDKDLACEQLAIAIHIPSSLSYGQLKLMLSWDALRGDQRFEKIVEEAKQPLALK
jgi:serine/threonine-protein kinase